MTRRALLLGGTGSLYATAQALARGGWAVTVTGRDPARCPGGAAEAGIRFVSSDRRDRDGLEALVGDGVDLLVDGQGYTPDQAPDLARLSRRCGSTAYLSAKAVYLDASGRHLNSPEPPRWDRPVPDTAETMTYAGQDYDSADGYGANKAESERILLGESERVSVLRPSKIFGAWVRQSRLRPLVDHLRRGEATLPVLTRAAARVESTTSTATLAAAVLACAQTPASRVVNVADSAPRPAGELVEVVVDALGVGEVRLVETSDPEVAVPLPTSVDMVLDTAELTHLLGGPPPSFADTVSSEVDWLLGLR